MEQFTSIEEEETIPEPEPDGEKTEDNHQAEAEEKVEAPAAPPVEEAPAAVTANYATGHPSPAAGKILAEAKVRHFIIHFNQDFCNSLYMLIFLSEY